MDYGFVRCGAVTPEVRVGDVFFNIEEMKKLIDEGMENKAKVLVFPELAVTGYTCSDLFLQTLLLKESIKGIVELKKYTTGKDMVIIVGFPFEYEGKLYNVAAIMFNGSILGLVPKKNIPNYSEFYEARHFTKGQENMGDVNIDGEAVPFGTNILFKSKDIENLVIGIEICEDLWVPMPPSIKHTIAGATVIANLSASDEVTGKDEYRKELVKGQSARLVCSYIYSSAGYGESSTDLVFSGHNIIAEDGIIINENNRFINESVYCDIDIDKISYERRRMTTYPPKNSQGYRIVEFSMKNVRDNELIRFVDKAPFVPSNTLKRSKRCEEIFMIQALGLKKRLAHTNSKTAIIGISGGLDSTLALLVTVKAFDLLNLDHSGIIAVTMPGFGTTDRTYTNAVTLIEKLGCTFKEISIGKAVLEHFKDIGHDKNIHDVTYENSQARQRTLLLMDLANEHNGLVIGTGDMSELALGWATYNGDHMSMYGVNSSVPKTLVRHLVQYYGDTCDDFILKDVLYDVLDTPVSPELLPPDELGTISQMTEDLVGPYELHDFFLYNILRFGYEPAKVYYLAKNAFVKIYDDETILKWLKVFYRRFFSQQFKRSCLPDGVKVGSVAVSPRGDLRMPSDAVGRIWMNNLESIER